MKRFFYSAALAAIVLNPAAALAQVEDEVILVPARLYEYDDAVVSVGTRIGTVDIEDIAAPVSVLTLQDITARNQTYVTDLLRSLPGIAVSQSGPAGNLTQLRLRGSEANHVLVLIDGIDASNPNTGAFDFAGLRAADIVKIEVLRGEQSALYGSDAIGGVINIITTSVQHYGGWRANVEAGSFDTVSGSLHSIIPLADNGANLSVSANAAHTDGYDITDGAGGGGDENDGSVSRAVNIGLNRVELGEVRLAAKFGYSNLVSEFDSDSNFDSRLDDTNDELTTQRYFASANARFDLGALNNALTASWSQTEAANPNAGFRNDLKGGRVTLNWTSKAELGDGVLTGLIETETEEFETFGGVGAGQNQSQSITNNALAADYSHDFGGLTVNASARADFNDRFEDEQTFRLGAVYAFDALRARLRGSIGTGVKNPGMTELFGFFPGSFVGNPNLQPESSLGYNLGYSQDFSDGQINIDLFRSELSNEIRTVFNPDFTSTVVNTNGASTREGVEIEGRYNLSNTLSLRGSATFLKARDEDGVEQVRRPNFIASATATWLVTDALSVTGSVDHTGDQLDLEFLPDFTSRNVTLDAYTLVGLNGRYAISDQFSLSLRGENLTDETYQEVLGYASQGRGIYIGLGADF